MDNKVIDSIAQFLQICNYEKAKFLNKIFLTEVSYPSDPNAKLVVNVVIEDLGYEKFVAGYTGNLKKSDYKKVRFQGPSLSSTCTISGINKTNYDREIGYIQTSKIFFEKQFEKAIFYSNFHANLLNGQEEVLDCDGENKPFYSTESCIKIRAGEEFKSNKTFTIKISDFLTSPGPPEHDWGRLLNQERYQQFFVYLVERSIMNNGEWKYDVLYSFDWFIYLKWNGENENYFEYDLGGNQHEKCFRYLPNWINSMEYYTCNDDRFEYRIDLENEEARLHIYNYPNSIFKNKLKMVGNVCEDINIKDLEENNVCKNVESISVKGKQIYEEKINMDSELVKWCDENKSTSFARKISEILVSMAAQETTVLDDNNVSEDYKNMVLKIKNLSKEISAKVSSEEMDCEDNKCMNMTKKKFREEVKKAIIELNKNNTEQDKKGNKKKTKRKHSITVNNELCDDNEIFQLCVLQIKGNKREKRISPN